MPCLEGTASSAHVVQAIGELDEDDAHVARHREQHLAEILGLRVLGSRTRAVDLRDAVHQLRHGLAKRRDLAWWWGVLDDIVEQRRRAPAVGAIGEDLRDAQRMRNVRLAALPVLPRVRRARGLVNFLDLSTSFA
jgi:hypothetical protein